MAIATLSEIKVLLQITDSTKDTLITALIPIVESDILEYLNNDFADEYPTALKVYVANMINFRIQKPKDGISSESISRYSVSYKSDAEFIAGYPSSIVKGLDKWRKVKWQ